MTLSPEAAGSYGPAVLGGGSGAGPLVQPGESGLSRTRP